MDIQSVKNRFGIIGNNPAMNRAIEIALRVAATDLSVVITGESGVGKEFFPQIIHSYSSRKHNKYIAVNCGAIPEGTIDSELFGHEKGSFTGASESRKGYFEEADGGTIFLDEVAELPLSTQVRLLRVLQTGEYIRVGSSKIHKTNVRVVAATNVNLGQAISDGRFREDLYYRLNTVPVNVPPLRERREDIWLLFRKFAADIAAQYRMPAITLTDEARKVLVDYSWPGNIRQLKNVAEQISAIEESREITPSILERYLPVTDNSPVPVTGRGSAADLGDERELLYKVLFDMRSEIHDIRRMLNEVVNAQNSSGATPHIAGLLPGSISGSAAGLGGIIPSITEHRSLGGDAEYALSEDVTETPPAEMTKEQAQREAIIKALKKHNGKRKEAARELFISERTLYRKIKELGINEI